MHKRITAGIAAGAIVIGSAGAMVFLLPNLVAAADPTASPAATTTAPSTLGLVWFDGHDTIQPGNLEQWHSDDGRLPRMPGGGILGSDDITAAAKALGMTEADVTTALQGGQTLAQLAATKNVDVQTLIDAMVAAEKAEIQAKVDAGTITQAQADQQIADLTQHETDEVNGVMGGPGGHHGHGPGDPSTGTRTTPRRRLLEPPLRAGLRRANSVPTHQRGLGPPPEPCVFTRSARGRGTRSVQRRRSGWSHRREPGSPRPLADLASA